MEDQWRNESLANQEYKKFFEVFGKIDETDIVLHYKLKNKLFREHFFNGKKWYIISLYAICDSDKKFTYMLISFSNAIYNT